MSLELIAQELRTGQRHFARDCVHNGPSAQQFPSPTPLAYGNWISGGIAAYRERGMPPARPAGTLNPFGSPCPLPTRCILEAEKQSVGRE
jgi:hypothetical protein